MRSNAKLHVINVFTWLQLPRGTSCSPGVGDDELSWDEWEAVTHEVDGGDELGESELEVDQDADFVRGI